MVTKHPARFLEFIPWTNMSRDGKDPTSNQMMWRPGRRSKFDHHLHTEEEVYRFCVNHELMFPGFMQDDAIVFLCTQLKHSTMWNELHEYWKKWVSIVEPASSSSSFDPCSRTTVRLLRIQNLGNGFYLKLFPEDNTASCMTRWIRLLQEGTSSDSSTTFDMDG